MSTQNFDVVIIGGGPGGYVAAIRAAQLGLRTALVEKAELGGVCLNWGCIPTKALLRSADVMRQIRDASQFGIQVAAPVADVPAMIARSRAIAAQLSKGIVHLMKKNKITVLTGHARLKGKGGLTLQDSDGKLTNLFAENIVIATGARPRVLEGLEPDGESVWTYRDALMPPKVPKRLLIIGAGAIGIEFACFYRTIGVEVTVADLADRVLPVEDEEISAQVATSMQRDGIAIHTGMTVKSSTKVASGWRVELQGNSTLKLDVDVVLVAAGIVGNVEDLGLENTAVKIEKTHIVTDAQTGTTEPGVFAIGDVAGAPWLAHKASHEGVICIEHIAGLHPHALRPERIPSCTYSHPQVASIGLTEARAKAGGRKIKVGKFPFAANGKAIAMGATTGFTKVIFDEATGELLGAHMVGDEVTEMIQGFAIAQELETTEADLMSTVFPHPTQSEAMHEAVLAAYGRALHI